MKIKLAHKLDLNSDSIGDVSNHLLPEFTAPVLNSLVKVAKLASLLSSGSYASLHPTHGPGIASHIHPTAQAYSHPP